LLSHRDGTESQASTPLTNLGLGSSPTNFPRAEHLIYVAVACDGGELGEPT